MGGSGASHDGEAQDLQIQVLEAGADIEAMDKMEKLL